MGRGGRGCGPDRCRRGGRRRGRASSAASACAAADVAGAASGAVGDPRRDRRGGLVPSSRRVGRPHRPGRRCQRRRRARPALPAAVPGRGGGDRDASPHVGAAPRAGGQSPLAACPVPRGQPGRPLPGGSGGPRGRICGCRRRVRLRRDAQPLARRHARPEGAGLRRERRGGPPGRRTAAGARHVRRGDGGAHVHERLGRHPRRAGRCDRPRRKPRHLRARRLLGRQLLGRVVGRVARPPRDPGRGRERPCRRRGRCRPGGHRGGDQVRHDPGSPSSR